MSLKPTTDPTDLWLAPGLVDIQVNGFGGHDANAADITPRTIAELAQAVWRSGVTTFCPTIITQSETHLCRSLAAIADACDTDPHLAHAIPCIHVEGPFISPEDGPRGAHPAQFVRPPDLDEYRHWQTAARGRVGLITLAPEWPGAVEFIRAVTDDGVIVALGHTAASSDDIQAAVEAGARLSTHLGNGAHAQLRRHPNYIWDQLAEDRLAASFIFDGHHLPPAVMKTVIRAKGMERSILISDAVALAGLPPGVYETPVGGKVELLPTGRLNLYGTPFLAGSASALADGVANAVRFTDASLAQAVAMASTNPARLLGLRGRYTGGRARDGADLTLFRFTPGAATLDIAMTIVGGQVVHTAA